MSESGYVSLCSVSMPIFLTPGCVFCFCRKVWTDRRPYHNRSRYHNNNQGPSFRKQDDYSYRYVCAALVLNCVCLDQETKLSFSKGTCKSIMNANNLHLGLCKKILMRIDY